MATDNQTPDKSALIQALQESGGHKTNAAKALGLHRSTFLNLLKREGLMQTSEARFAKVAGDEYAIAPLPKEVDVADLLGRRKEAFRRKQRMEEASKLIPVRVKVAGPIGIWFAGDPHVDDDGTNLALLEQHTAIVRETPGMFGASVGDTTNNWIGRLARLYGEQGTTAAEAWALAEWLVAQCPWLFMIAGNHDLWSGSGDPLQWIARQAGALYRPSECRLALVMPGGRECRINARHDFAGNSQWNPAHGPMKALQMGVKDHIAICGHKHASGYGVIKDGGTGQVCHAIQVASYKIYDRFAKERGFRDQYISPCACVVIDPDATEASFVQMFWEPEPAAEYLTWLRKKRGYSGGVQ